MSTELWHYIEDLVALTAGSAEDAVGASRQARDAARSATRGIIAFAGLGAAGAIAGVVGLVGLHAYHTTMQRRVTELTAEIRALDTVQQQTNAQLARLRSEYAIALKQQAEPAPSVIPSAAASEIAQPAPRRLSPGYSYYAPLGGYSYYPPPSSDAPLRPVSQPPARRTVVAARRPEPPRFVALFLRNVGALFR